MRKALLYFLSITTVASLLAGAAVGAQSTQVLVVPPSSQVAPGASVTVEVQVRNVVDLYAVDLGLAFDPAVLEVVDADGDSANGTQIAAGSFLRSVYMFTAVNRADNVTGQIRYVVSLLSPAAPVSGSGVLASITFQVRNPGSSTLRLSVLLANNLAGYIPAVVSDGSVVVTGNTATPTVTVVATNTRTRTPTLTATPIATVTRTATPVATFTPSRTLTRTPTRTGSPPARDHFVWLPLLLRALLVPTLTPLPSATPTVTATRSPAPTASPTATAGGTPSPSPTGGLTPSATPSATPTPTASTLPSPTASAMPSATRSPTPTPTTSVIASPTTSATPSGTVTVSPTPESRQLLLNSSFEVEDDAVWAREGGAPPVYTMARAHTGVRSMRLGIILPQSAVYSSVRQDVDLPSHITEARLSLYYLPVGWPEDTDYIYLYVTRASDGTTLFSDGWTQWDQTWHQYTADLLSQLRPYAGQRVRLRVGAYNDGYGMTAVYLDDVELWVSGAGWRVEGIE